MSDLRAYLENLDDTMVRDRKDTKIALNALTEQFEQLQEQVNYLAKHVPQELQSRTPNADEVAELIASRSRLFDEMKERDDEIQELRADLDAVIGALDCNPRFYGKQEALNRIEWLKRNSYQVGVRFREQLIDVLGLDNHTRAVSDTDLLNRIYNLTTRPSYRKYDQLREDRDEVKAQLEELRRGGEDR